MGRQIYPELNLWETAAPFIENWVKERIGIASIGKRLKKKFPIWMETLPELPEQVAKSISEIKNIQHQQMEQTRQLKKLTEIMEKRERDKSLLLLSLAILAGFIFFYWIYINL